MKPVRLPPACSIALRSPLMVRVSIILILFLDAVAIGQKTLNPEFRPPDVLWDNFLTKDGDAGQTSTCILIDKKGFVWSGTETGLYRFDGSRYIEYGVSTGDNKGFAGLVVNNIFEDSDGTLWIGTTRALNKLDQVTGTFTHYYPDTSQSHFEGKNFIRSVNEDRSGLLWIRTGKDIFSFNRTSGTFKRFATDSLSWYYGNSLYMVEEQCYAEDPHNNKWFVTCEGLYLAGKDNSFRKILPDDRNNDLKGLARVSCVSTDSHGNIWIGTEGAGLLRWNEIDRKPEKASHYTAAGTGAGLISVSAILTTSDGRVWSFGDNSFSVLDPAVGEIRDYRFIYRNQTVYESATAPVRIQQAFQDYNGTIWFLNKAAGLMFRFEPASEKLSLYRTPTFVIFQCIMDKAGSFWFASVRDNIYRMVTASIPFYTIPGNNTADVAPIHRGPFFEDGRGNLWLLFNKGTYTVQNFDVAKAIIPEQFRFPESDVTAGTGLEDNKGYLWFGARSGKLTRYDPRSGRHTDFTPYAYYDNSDVSLLPQIREDRHGDIWAASPGHGLYRFDRSQGKFEPFGREGKFSGRNLRSIYDFLIDRNGDFWLLTDNAVLRLMMPGMEVVDYGDSADGSFAEHYSNIRVSEDSEGRVLILNSRNGLFLFDRKNDSFTEVSVPNEGTVAEFYDLLIDSLDRIWLAGKKGIMVFDRATGSRHSFVTPKLQYDIQSYRTKEGYILYLNENEIYIFREDFPLNKEIPPVYLTRLLVNGKEYNGFISPQKSTDVIGKISLTFRQNTLRFEFAALNYLSPRQNRYSYFMKGIDRDTVRDVADMSAEYRGMSPGRYRFWVTGSNNDGFWNPEGASFDVIIRQPWHRSIVAFGCYVLIAGILIWAYIRKRIYDLTRDKMKLEAEVKSRTAELELKNLRFAELDRIKTRFFTDISHEIRTPLSLILGPLENIPAEEFLSERASGLIDMMKRNARRLMHLVNQLLDISRLDAGKMKILLTNEDIVSFLRILVYEFLSIAESKRISYVADLPDNEFVTWFDRDKIEKIVLNLLSNAFKYTPYEGTVQCQVKTFTARPGSDRSDLYLKITDSGPGISREERTKIFDRFYRVEGRLENGVHGTGIGLSLVSEFVSLLHGEISVNSPEGNGSEFTVIIPLGKDHLSAEEYIIVQSGAEAQITSELPAWKERFRPADTGPLPKGRLKILIIEDNRELRNFIRDSLGTDYFVIDADNGISGLNTAFTMMPDLIITDIMMPDLDGIKLCLRLKNDERTSHIPIIMLTAMATIDDKISGLKTGADDYMIKPFNMEELKTRIANLIAMRSQLKKKYATRHDLSGDQNIPESIDDKFIGKVIRIIKENLTNYDFDVGHLQDHLGMSRMHLSRKIKILTGHTAGTFIRNIRLERAAELLLHRAGNITEVANSVGISNPSHFTRIFRNYFGVSPRAYSSQHNRPVQSPMAE